MTGYTANYTVQPKKIGGGWAVVIFRDGENFYRWACPPGTPLFVSAKSALADYNRRLPDPARGAGLPAELQALLKG